MLQPHLEPKRIIKLARSSNFGSPADYDMVGLFQVYRLVELLVWRRLQCSARHVMQEGRTRYTATQRSER